MAESNSSDLKSRLLDFQWRGLSVPGYMHQGLLAYLEYGVRPGEFLYSLLQGDLFKAYSYADEENIKAIGAYVAFLYMHANCRAFGSKEKVSRWLDTKAGTRQITTT